LPGGWLKGAVGAKVLEIISQHDGNAYRVVYTVQFSPAVEVLHAFQKKSTHGIATPAREIHLIVQRLKRAEAHHRDRFNEVERKEQGA
jgi:phage-related protein